MKELFPKKQHIQAIIEQLGVLRNETLSIAGALALSFALDKLKRIEKQLPK